MPTRGKQEWALNKPPIKHMTHPIGDAAVETVQDFTKVLCEVINGCPTEPDAEGYEWIEKGAILRMIEIVARKHAEQNSSFDFNAWTREKEQA